MPCRVKQKICQLCEKLVLQFVLKKWYNFVKLFWRNSMKIVYVTVEMWKNLNEFKREGNFRDINELIKWMINELERLQKEKES